MGFLQVYSKVSGEPALESPTIDISSKEFYGEGYDDSDRRIPDMTIINRQLGKQSISKQTLDQPPLQNFLLTFSFYCVFPRMGPEDITLGLA